MKDIHSQINSVVKTFACVCAKNRISHYYNGHSHHSRGIDMTFEVVRMTESFFSDLQSHFVNFYMRHYAGRISVVIRLFEDDELPF